MSTQDFGKVPYLSHSAGGVGFGWMASGSLSSDGLDIGVSCGEAARRVEGQGEGCRFVSKERRWRRENDGFMAGDMERGDGVSGEGLVDRIGVIVTFAMGSAQEEKPHMGIEDAGGVTMHVENVPYRLKGLRNVSVTVAHGDGSKRVTSLFSAMDRRAKVSRVACSVS